MTFPVLPLLGAFAYIWSFSVLSGVLGFLLKIWVFIFRQILEMYVALLYSPFKNTVFLQAPSMCSQYSSQYSSVG